MTENKLELYFAKKAINAGGKSYKLLSNTNGLPDRILLLNGLCYLVELKTDKGKLSKLQELRHIEIQTYYNRLFVLKGKDEIDRFFLEVCDYEEKE
jgi:hypothetical protein